MHRWFHPNLNNLEAERLLVERGEDGSFLVRPSKSCAGHFSLSVRRKDKVTHIKIRHVGDFYYLNSSHKFATLAELVQFYMENQVKENEDEVFELKKPLNSSDPITERWFHGSINGATAERLIKEKGVTGSFLVRESQSKVGDYVLTVRTKDGSNQDDSDKVTHLMIRHHNNKYDVYGGEKFDSLTELVEHYKQNPMVETSGTVVNMKYPFNATHITALDIDTRIVELSKENPQINAKEGFWEEFEHLQHQECKVLFTRKVGQEERNMLKNRYKNILPYDYTRVILKKPTIVTNSNKNGSLPPLKLGGLNTTTAATINAATTTETDYINANFIKLVDNDTTISPKTKPVPHSKIYIATQGPLPNTVADFWWMVWQERSDCIVMVTKEVERGKNKCYRYWPTLELQSQRCGPIEIKILSDSSTTLNNKSTSNQAQQEEIDYVCREFELRFMGHDENNDCQAIRRVVQYQYYAWPDQNTPSNPTSVVNFLTNINQRPPTGPMIVHCSAGIGRSGTLIVIDMLMDQLNHHGLTYEIDIQRIVKIARAQRSGLVQTEAQYKFIYLAIQNYITLMKRWMSFKQQHQQHPSQQSSQQQQQQQKEPQGSDNVVPCLV